MRLKVDHETFLILPLLFILNIEDTIMTSSKGNNLDKAFKCTYAVYLLEVFPFINCIGLKRCR